MCDIAHLCWLHGAVGDCVVDCPSVRVCCIVHVQVEDFARSRDLSIVGVSYGNELDAQESILTQWPIMMGGKIAEQFASPAILMVRMKRCVR